MERRPDFPRHRGRAQRTVGPIIGRAGCRQAKVDRRSRHGILAKMCKFICHRCQSFVIRCLLIGMSPWLSIFILNYFSK